MDDPLSLKIVNDVCFFCLFCMIFIFIPDFDNHIYVTTDAEAFFFLHDLISSYLKEKERVLNIQQQQHGN